MALADTEIAARAPTSAENLPAEPLLQIDGAIFAYGDTEVLAGLDLDVGEGEIFVLLGPNGAGKSTLARAIAGRLALSAGTIRIGGSDPVSSPRARRLAGFVPQKVAVYESLTTIENLRAMGRIMGAPRSRVADRAEALNAVIGLRERADDRARVLSGGMRRRLNIGMALMHGPRLLVLDEPTAGVDVAGRVSLQRLIFALRDQGLAILLTTHDMEEAEALADRVGIIVDGRIHASGTPTALVEHLFGTSKELVARLGPEGAPAGSTVNYTLRRNGFVADAMADQWRALVKWSDSDIAHFIEHLISTEPALREIGVRRPGLDTVLARFTAKR